MSNYLIVDLPPGTGDVQLSLIQKARPAGALIVSTPQDLSLIDATRAIDLFRKTERAGARASSRIWPAMSARTAARLATRSAAAAPRRRRRARRRLPWPPAAVGQPARASDAGTPPAAGDGPAAEAFAELAGKLLAELEKVAA